MLHDQQPQQHLGGCRVPTVDGGQPVAVRQVSAHLLVQVVVIEQLVELDEHGVRLLSQFGHAGKHIFHRVAIDQHSLPPLGRIPPLGHAAATPVPGPAWAHHLQIAPLASPRPTHAATIRAALGAVARFSHAEQVVASAALEPRTRQSGACMGGAETPLQAWPRSVAPRPLDGRLWWTVRFRPEWRAR